MHGKLLATLLVWYAACFSAASTASVEVTCVTIVEGEPVVFEEPPERGMEIDFKVAACNSASQANVYTRLLLGDRSLTAPAGTFPCGDGGPCSLTIGCKEGACSVSHEVVYQRRRQQPPYLMAGVLLGALGVIGCLAVWAKTRANKRHVSDGEHEYNVIVVGAGVIGAAAAAALGKQGRKVLVVERDLSEPNRIVGELLQPSGVDKLRALGLEECVEGIGAATVRGYAIYHNGSTLQCDYGGGTDSEEAPSGRGFHHGRFVMKLRAAARACPSVSLVQGTVTALVHSTEENKHADDKVVGVRYKDEAGASRVATAQLTVVCDGCFSKFRKQLGPEKPRIDVQSYFYGLIIPAELPLPNHGLVCISGETPAVIYPIANKEARALISFPANRRPSPGALRTYLREVFVKTLPVDVQTAFLECVDDVKISSMPNQHMPARGRLVPGAIMLGDALNMRHPFTGGGMTCGLTDVVKLKRLLARVPDLGDGARVQGVMREFYNDRSDNAAINILASALFEVFSERYHLLRDACFAYLSEGPERYNGPVSLLSGTSRSQWLLLYHFFSVAFFGVKLAFKQASLPTALADSCRMLKDAVVIIQPLVMSEATSVALKFIYWGADLVRTES